MAPMSLTTHLISLNTIRPPPTPASQHPPSANWIANGFDEVSAAIGNPFLLFGHTIFEFFQTSWHRVGAIWLNMKASVINFFVTTGHAISGSFAAVVRATSELFHAIGRAILALLFWTMVIILGLIALRLVIYCAPHLVRGYRLYRSRRDARRAGSSSPLLRATTPVSYGTSWGNGLDWETLYRESAKRTEGQWSTNTRSNAGPPITGESPPSTSTKPRPRPQKRRSPPRSTNAKTQSNHRRENTPPPSATPRTDPPVNTSRSSAEDAFEEWSLRYKRALKRKEMSAFPEPPHECCEVRDHPIPCHSDESKRQRKLVACEHSIENMLQSARMSVNELKKYRRQWHPDAFCACPEAYRETFKAKAEEIFKVCEKIYSGMLTRDPASVINVAKIRSLIRNRCYDKTKRRARSQGSVEVKKSVDSTRFQPGRL